MPVSTASPAPYAPGSAILGLLARSRSRGLITPITKDVLTRAGVSDSLVARTLQSLQTLDLIDESGNPTPTMAKLRTVAEDEYKAAMAEWLQSAYAEVFQFADPRYDDAVRVRDAFRAYAPHGQQDRMVSLFMALCAEANIIEAQPGDGKQPARKSPRVGAPPAPKRPRVVATKASAPASPAPPPSGLAPSLTGMLESIPKGGKGWTQVDRDKFLLAFSAVLDFAVPIIDPSAVPRTVEPDQEEDDQ